MTSPPPNTVRAMSATRCSVPCIWSNWRFRHCSSWAWRGGTAAAPRAPGGTFWWGSRRPCWPTRPPCCWAWPAPASGTGAICRCTCAASTCSSACTTPSPTAAGARRSCTPCASPARHWLCCAPAGGMCPGGSPSSTCTRSASTPCWCSTLCCWWRADTAPACAGCRRCWPFCSARPCPSIFLTNPCTPTFTF